MTAPLPREGAIVRAILEDLRGLGPDVFAFKVHGGPYQIPGLPDICAVVSGPGACGQSVWLEVKRPGEDATPLQIRMMARLRQAGAVAEVVRSKEEARRVVEGVLQGTPPRAA